MAETRASSLEVQTLEHGSVLRLVLDHGRGNVIDRALVRELGQVVRQAAPDPKLRAILLDHAGPHFSYGASMAEHAPGLVETMLPELHALARDLVETPLCTLAAVRGLCLGGGFELVALTDRIHAAPDAQFGQPEIELGVFAPIGSALLPRLVGPRLATDWLLSGRRIEAAEAERCGLVAALADDPSEAALAWIRENLLPRSAVALRHAVRAARRAWSAGFLSDLGQLEAHYLGELMATHDAREGIAAFLAKRPPRWEDR
jgi:cyclohexa-1,5-dienecarbonyl-CoA hydratase